MTIPAPGKRGESSENRTEQDLGSTIPAATDELPQRHVPHMITAPARAGRWFRRWTPALSIVALLLALPYLPRECYNRDGQPKIKHKSREDAIQHKRSLLIQSGEPGWTLKVYQCSRCGSWHVGHAGSRRRRGGRR